MRYHLDHKSRIGGREVAVISKIEVNHRRFGGLMAFQCKKTPWFVLIRDGASESAFEMSGAPVTTGALERLCPGLATSFFGKATSH